MKLHIIWCNPLWLWLKIMLRVSTRWSNRPKGKNFLNWGLLGGLFCRKIGILRIENVTLVAFLFHRRLNFWLTCKVLGLKWCQECLLEHQIGQNTFFFKRGDFWWAIFSKRRHFAVSECDPHLSQNLWGAYLLSQMQNFGLKMMPRVSTWRSNRSKYIFFQKGGFWGAFFLKKNFVSRPKIMTCGSFKPPRRLSFCPTCKILGSK